MKTLIRTLLLVLCVQAKAQLPLFSSYPSAQAVIFLDFDGHTVSGTSWNSNGPIFCEPSGLNAAQITEVFNRVAEDYRPFDVNVTTDSTRFLAAPLTARMRVIITTSSSWYGAAGGVSFVGSFSWGDNNPCFVFSQLLSFNVKNIAEAVSHEAGHTLGLYHQAYYDANCNKISDYYAGQGSGEIGWAPIMGVGYYQNLTLWNYGPNSYGCSSMQSDLDVITSGANGFGYRTDDHSNSFAGATLASISNNQFDVTGVIERNTDVDYFRFTVPANGRFQLDAVPYHVGNNNSGSDLDLQVSLFNNAQTLLNVYNPGALLSSVIDTTLVAGTYYLKVEGKGNMYAPGYASLGSYSMIAQSTPGTTLSIQRLELHGAALGDQHNLDWIISGDDIIAGQSLEISTDGRNFQQLAAIPVDVRAYHYRPASRGTALYRLAVTLADGHTAYSNIVTIRDDGSVVRPRLSGTVVSSAILSVSSPGDFHYSILDMRGRLVSQGKLVSGINNLPAPVTGTGIYLIRFTDHQQFWTDKFILP